MRSFAGIFLCLMGALFAAPALLGWIILTAIIPSFLADNFADPLGMALVLGSVLVVGFFFTMGHVMLCLSHSMLGEQPPFPSDRPILWFTLRTLQLLLLASIIGCTFSLFMILLSNHLRFMVPILSTLVAIPLLILAFRRVKAGIDVLEH